jgi:hypothetical protein
MKSKVALIADDRLRIAERLKELSDDLLSLNAIPKDYISLELGTASNKNAIHVNRHSDRVSFYLRSHDLLNRLATAGFAPQLSPQTKPMFRDRYRIFGLNIDLINQNVGLFRDAVAESIEVLQSRKPAKKRKLRALPSKRLNG